MLVDPHFLWWLQINFESANLTCSNVHGQLQHLRVEPTENRQLLMENRLIFNSISKEKKYVKDVLKSMFNKVINLVVTKNR